MLVVVAVSIRMIELEKQKTDIISYQFESGATKAQ